MAMLPDLRKKCWKPFSIFGGAKQSFKKVEDFSEKEKCD
jgi:hypothetical protein